MIPAHEPVQRPRDAKLLVVDRHGRITHHARSRFVTLLNRGDLVVANDAATLPASLEGRHLRTGSPIELRLAGWPALDGVFDRNSVAGHERGPRFVAVIFGPGDYHTRTEDRPSPAAVEEGDILQLGPLSATIDHTLGHPRLAVVRFDGSRRAFRAGLARHGRPIQYAHVPAPLVLWDVWAPIASAPVAFEPPSAGFVLDWTAIAALADRGVGFETITHAAGLSSTGDSALDARFPLDEPYRIPRATASAIQRARRSGGRIVAVGTTVVRALEHAAARDGCVRAGEGMANQRLGPDSDLRVVDAVLSGTHEPDSSHYQLLRAFARDATLASATDALEAHAYRTHEFGDSVFVERRCGVPARDRSRAGVDRPSDLHDPSAIRGARECRDVPAGI